MITRNNALFVPGAGLVLLALVILCLPAMASAQDWGEVREATANLNVRDARSPNGTHVVTLAKGQRVKTDFPKDGWVAVFNLNETERDLKKAVGYANIKFLKKVEPTKSTAKASDTAKPAEKVPAKPVEKSGEGEVSAPVKTVPLTPLVVGIDPSRTPVKINSDRMTYDESGRVVSFIGNVVAVHGELTLWADKLSAYLTTSSAKNLSSSSIDRIVASGHVRAKKGTTNGTCGLLTYEVGPQILKMEQDPKLQDGPNSLTGEVITFYVKTNRSEVIGGKQRVNAIFMTPDKNKGK